MLIVLFLYEIHAFAYTAIVSFPSYCALFRLWDMRRLRLNHTFLLFLFSNYIYIYREREYIFPVACFIRMHERYSDEPAVTEKLLFNEKSSIRVTLYDTGLAKSDKKNKLSITCKIDLHRNFSFVCFFFIYHSTQIFTTIRNTVAQ